MEPKENAIGKVEVVPVRSAFRHEAINFTRWLEENIEALSDRIGFELTVIQREKRVGDFHVDLVCEDGNGSRVIVENQLEATDHDHLGKLLTYLVNLDAKIAIWIATEARSEHRRVVDWLNENTETNIAFYLVKVEAIRIGQSPYAPLFTVLTRPEAQLKEIGVTKKDLTNRELAERHHKRYEFWTALLEKSKSRTNLFSTRTPSTDHWLSMGAGKGGINFNYLILKDGAAIDIYIDVGEITRNKAIFDALAAQRDEIERNFGDTLDWRRLDNKRASRIVKRMTADGNLNQPESWIILQDAMIEAMIKFEAIFRPRLVVLKDM